MRLQTMKSQKNSDAEKIHRLELLLSEARGMIAARMSYFYNTERRGPGASIIARIDSELKR